MVKGCGARSLRDFIERTSLPLYTITMAKGVVSDEHPLCLGYADPALNPAVHTAFKEADLFLVLGKRIDYRLALGGPRLFAPAAKFIQVDIHAQELGMESPAGVGDLGGCAVHFYARCSPLRARKSWTPLPWLDRVRELRRDWEAKLAETAQERLVPDVSGGVFFAEPEEVALPKDIYYAWDGGDVVHWGRATLPALHPPGRWLRLGPLGTIGSALPNSLAVQLASPGKPVVLITGDGSLGFYIAEMDTAVRHGLPVVMIVGNDGGWGLERELQGATAGTTIACELRRTQYDQIMKGFGGGGETIDTLDQVRPAVERAFGSGVPYCLNT